MANGNDAEVKLRFTAEVADAEAQMKRAQELLEQFKELVQGTADDLSGMGEEAYGVADAVGLMRERAAKTGNEGLQQVVDGSFSVGAERAAGLGERHGKITAQLERLGDRMREVAGEFEAGELTAGQAVVRLERLVRVAVKARRAVDGLGEAVVQTEQDLMASNALDDFLGKFSLVGSEVDDSLAAVRRMKDGLLENSAALREQQAGLDKSAAGYHQANAALEGYIGSNEVLVRHLQQTERALEAQKAKLAEVGMNADGSPASVEESAKGLERLAEAHEKQVERIDQAKGKLRATLAREAAKDEREVEKAEARAEREAAAAEKAAEREAKAKEREAEKAARAAEREAAAAERLAEKEAVTTAEMRFSMMNKQQLAAAVERLTRARQEAARVKDRKRYAELTRELMAANRQMEHVNRSLQMNRIAGAQQVQMAQSVAAGVSQMGSELASFGQNVEDGTVSLQGMSSAAIGLGMAIKTGMGPIGWAMLALESLVAAWNFFAQKRKADEAWRLEEARKEAELQRKVLEDVERLRREGAERSAAAFADLYRQQQEGLERERAERERVLAERKAGDEEAHRHRLAMLNIELESAKGKDRKRIEARVAAEVEAHRQAGLVMQRQEADVAAAFADELEAGLRVRGERMGELMTAWLPDIEAVERRSRELMADAAKVVELSEVQREGLERQQREAREQMQHILRLVRGVDKDFTGTAEDAVRWAARMQEIHREQEKVVEATRAQVAQLREAAELSRRSEENRRREEAASREVAQEREREARYSRRLAEVLGRRLSRQYEPQDRRTQDEVFAADERLLRRKLAAVNEEVSRLRAEGAERGALLQLYKRRWEVQRQLVGLEEARVEETRRGIERMRRFEAQDMTAPTRRRDRRADELSERYAQMAVRAQAALDRGLKRRAEGYLAKMDRMAARIDRLTGDEQGSRMNREVQGALRLQLDAVRRTARAKRRTAAAAEREAAAAGAQGAARQRNVAELEGAVRRLREENGRLARFLDGSAAAMRELVGVCRALQGQVNRALGELEVVRGQVRTLQASVRSVARK